MRPIAAVNVHESVLELLKKEKRIGRILDAAAGEGALSKKLLDMGFEVYPIDKDPSLFQLSIIKCKRVDLNYEIPYPNEFFDFICCVETIEHLWNPFGCIREFYRVLKNEGKLVLSTPNISTIFSRILFLFTGRVAGFLDVDYRKSGHITPIHFWQLQYIMKDIGFRSEETTYNRGYLPILRVGMPIKNLFFGQILITKFVKKVIKTESKRNCSI